MAELIGLTGAFDYIEYVGEYSTFTTEQLENFGRAIDLFPDMSSMMKVEEASLMPLAVPTQWKALRSISPVEAIDPAKDVDGFHPVNVGKLMLGEILSGQEEKKSA